MTEDDMRKRIDELQAELERRSRRRDEWIIGQAITGLCANPAFLTLETSSEENLGTLVETACDIARHVAVCRGEVP